MISLSKERSVHQREIYGILDVIGDLGGVLDVIIFIFGLLLFPISEHSFIMKALQKLFLARTDKEDIFEKVNP
jgi:hypothetical protein